MKHIVVICFIFCLVLSTKAQTKGDMNDIFILATKEMKSKRVEKIKPSITCCAVTYCTMEYSDINIRFEKCIDDSISKRRIFVNSKEFEIVILKNGEDEINKYSFPEYNFSTYIYDRKNNVIKIMSNLPSCTGISCQYQMFQIIYLRDKKCYERIVKYY